MEPDFHYALAKDLFEAVPEAGEDMRARPDGETPLAYIARLKQSKTPEEAVTFMAYVLPRRKAVWWGHQCLMSVDHLLSPQDKRMLQVAESWVREPEEYLRYQAMNEAMAAPDTTPGTWIAFGAAWSGGSLNSPDLPRVSPPPFATPRAVNTAIMGVLAKVDTKHRATTLNAFVDMGVGLANR
jgi:hypothetical protein